MLLDIPKNEKVYIGKVIDFKRKKEGLSIDYLIREVCSKNTYYKLQKDIVLESEIYDRLLKKLGLYYNYQKKENISFEILWHYFHIEDWKRFKTEKKNIIKRINHKDVWQYPVYIALNNMNYDTSFDLNSTMELQELLPYEYREMLSYFVIDFFYRENNSTIYASLIHISMNEFVNKVQYLFCLIKVQKYYSAVILCEELMQNKEHRKYYLVLLAKLFIIQEIEPAIFDEYCDELQKDNHFQGKDAFTEFSYIAGILYYKNKQYEKAWKYLLNSVKEKRYRVISFLYINHMETMTRHKFKDKEKYLLDIKDNAIDEPMRIFIKYYQMKNNQESFDKLNQYLWDTCRKNTAFFYPEDIMKNIIHDELYWIATKTNDKTKYYKFNAK